MNVPFLDFRAHVAALRGELDAAIARVLDSGWFILGPEGEALERELAQALMAGLKKIEDHFPSLHITFLRLRYPRGRAPGAQEVRELVGRDGFRVKEIAYHLDADDQLLEYRMVIATRSRKAVEALAERLCGMPDLRGFEFAPSDE